MADHKHTTTDDDAELIALCVRWIEAERDYLDAWIAVEHAEGRLEAPEPPAALDIRESDWPRPRGDVYGAEGRRIWSKMNVDYLRSLLHDRQHTSIAAGNAPHAERHREIVAAYDGWQAASAAARDASGFTAAAEASERAQEAGRALARLVAFTPARTVEGLATKAAAVRSVWEIDPERDLALALERDDGEEAIQVSLLRDVLELARAHGWSGGKGLAAA